MSSVPTNIDDGSGWKTDADFAKFLRRPFGLASEMEHELLLAHELSYLAEDKDNNFNNFFVEIQEMRNNLIV